MTKCPYSYFDYCVEQNDTYPSLAAKFRVNEKALRDINSNAALTQGMLMKIPSNLGGCTRGTFYAIRKGDTLSSIAKRNSMTTETLLGANPYLNPAYYIPGQIIVIPQIKHIELSDFYTVAANEGLFDVLRRYNMNLTTFCALNPDINPMEVKPGQRVIIKKKQEAVIGRWYTVQQGDTVGLIARKFGIKIPHLLAANENVRPSEFIAGTRVRIPAK